MEDPEVKQIAEVYWIVGEYQTPAHPIHKSDGYFETMDFASGISLKEYRGSVIAVWDHENDVECLFINGVKFSPV